MTLALQKPVLEPFYFCALGGFTYLPDAQTPRLVYSPVNYQFTSGVEYLFGPFSISTQYIWYSGLLEDPSRFSENRSYLAGTVKWQLHRRLLFTLAVVQNLEPTENSADVTFQAGLQLRI